MKKILILFSLFIPLFNVYALDDEQYDQEYTFYSVFADCYLDDDVSEDDIGNIKVAITDGADEIHNLYLTYDNNYSQQIDNLSFGQDMLYTVSFMSKDLENNYNLTYSDKLVENKFIITINITKKYNDVTEETVTTTSKYSKEEKNAILVFIKYLFMFLGFILLIFVIHMILKIQNANK